jgi:hypothetical protein
MLNPNFFERVIAWVADVNPEGLASARATFEALTAPIDAQAPDYEARISHFFEAYVCSPIGKGRAPISEFAALRGPFDALEQEQLRGYLHSHRTLIEVIEIQRDEGRVRDRLFDGRYRVRLSDADRELYVGDKFDGRLVPLGSAIVLSPGRVYHPREAHSSLDQLLAEAGDGVKKDPSTLDALLRMRARFLRFESIRAEHVYRFDALSESSFAAPWARARERE